VRYSISILLVLDCSLLRCGWPNPKAKRPALNATNALRSEHDAHTHNAHTENELLGWDGGSR